MKHYKLRNYHYWCICIVYFYCINIFGNSKACFSFEVWCRLYCTLFSMFLTRLSDSLPRPFGCDCLFPACAGDVGPAVSLQQQEALECICTNTFHMRILRLGVSRRPAPLPDPTAFHFTAEQQECYQHITSFTPLSRSYLLQSLQKKKKRFDVEASSYVAHSILTTCKTKLKKKLHTITETFTSYFSLTYYSNL